MATDRTATNYSGKGGKTNVQMQGHTDSGAFGSECSATRRIAYPPAEVKP